MVLIGVLGFVPFATAAVCVFAGVRAFEAAIDLEIDRAAGEFAVAPAPAVRRLAILHWVVPDRLLASRSALVIDDEVRWERFEAAFRVETGVDLAREVGAD